MVEEVMMDQVDVVTAEASEIKPDDHMTQIDKLITYLESIREQFGNTCVYVRRHGLSWGATALNYRDDDKKHGVFDLQASHDRDMLQHYEQVQRLIEQYGAERRAHEATLADLREALKVVGPLAAANTYQTGGPDNCGITIHTSEGIVRRAVAIRAKYMEEGT